MTQHRNLAYGDRFPEAVSDALQEFISTLLVNLRLTLANSTTVQIVAAVGNGQVAAGIQGKWRYITATINAAHPGGGAAQYDVFVTANDNSFAASGLPPGNPPEIDNTNYAFFLTIKPQGTTPSGSGSETLYRKIGEVTWDGTKITRISMTAGPVTAGLASEFVAITPENAARNVIVAAADFVPFSIKRRTSGDGSDLFELLDHTGGVIVRFTRDGLVMPVSLTSAQRDAITVGHRPPGGILYNSDRLQHETNIGSDAVPLWSGVGGYGPGIGIEFYGPETQIPPRTAVTDGRFLDKTLEPGLWNKLTDNGAIGNVWDTFGGLPAPPANKYRVPDLRGRGTIGKKNMGTGNADTPTLTGAAITRAAAATLGSLFGEEFHTLLVAEMPPHIHTGATGVQSANHTHTDAGHVHTINDPTHQHHLGHIAAGSGSSDATQKRDGSGSYTELAATGISINTGFASLGIQSASHTHSIPSDGFGGSHENVYPVVVVNKLITL